MARKIFAIWCIFSLLSFALSHGAPSVGSVPVSQQGLPRGPLPIRPSSIAPPSPSTGFRPVNLPSETHTPPAGPPPEGPSQGPPAAPPANFSCPRDPQKLKVCVDVLSGVVGVQIGPCCNRFRGLVTVEVAACLCDAIKANVFGVITEDWSQTVANLTDKCGLSMPKGYECK